MTPRHIAEIEARLGVRFPAEWKRWSPGEEHELVRGVASLHAPEAYARGPGGAVVVGMTTAGTELALLPEGRSATLRPGVYELGDGPPRRVAEAFDKLFVPRPAARAPRADEVAWEMRTTWAAYLTEELRVCSSCGAEITLGRTCVCGTTAGPNDPLPERTPDALAAARAALPDLFAVAEGVAAHRADHPWLGSTELLALETARSRRTPGDAILARWEERGLAPDAALVDAVRTLMRRA